MRSGMLSCTHLMIFSQIVCHSLFKQVSSLSSIRAVASGHRHQRHWQPQLQFSSTARYFATKNLEFGAGDDDLKRWEDMYYEGEVKAIMSKGGDLYLDARMAPTEVRVISLDLDNTLWNTGGCINAANDAVAAKMEQDGLSIPKRVEVIMGELFQNSKTTYCPMSKDGTDVTSPVLLTKLRKDAIYQLAVEHNDYSEMDALKYADEAFATWTNARHEAIPKNFADSVVPTLRKLRAMESSKGKKVVIGAITDGNSDPRTVPEIAEFIDFYVNAEQVGIAKPSSKIYMEAIRRAAVLPDLSDIFGGVDMDNDEAVEARIGGFWVHIGDDFIKDIVAAKEMNMRTIWALELIRDQLPKVEKEPKRDDDATRLEDFIREVAEKSRLEMPIGASDYLANSIQGEFMDAKSLEFKDVCTVLEGWQSEVVLALADVALRDKEDADAAAPMTIPTVLDEKDGANDVQPTKPDTSYDTKDDTSQQARALPRILRIVRDEYRMDLPIPVEGRSSMLVKELMAIAQSDKSSGVFAFPQEDVEGLRTGKTTLFISIEGAGLEFTREIFLRMGVEEVLSLVDENPLILSLSIRQAPQGPNLDIF